MSGSADAKDVMELAIIGMSCRFPGASDVEAYWRNLREGVGSITFLSDAELLKSHVDPALLDDPSYVKAGGILDQIEWFDASFFGYSPREASLMDPQHRLFLECAWEALEHAGYTPGSHDRATGVYGGAAMNGYLLFNLATRPDVAPALFDYLIQIGNDKDYLTTRVSYKLNLKGPSINVQTACSTSLVAVHVACQSLLNGECNLALAGGVSISVPQKVGYVYREGGLHSIDGYCRPFDAQARGTVFGSGAGIVVLKRLTDALGDGDHIYAIIKGSAVNNDGSDKVGYTAPGVDGQAAAIAEALAVAGVNADSIGYVETHGTGTPMGDPIEVKALTQAFRETTERKGYCALGAVKSNIGHLDVAAGVAALIKAALALKYGQIPPTLHFRTPNPEIDFENSPFFVNAELSDWKPDKRRAGVSSFGLGGTNAHVVLEEPPQALASGPSRPWQLLLLSARSLTALDRMCKRLADHLESHPGRNLADVAFTLQTGREVFSQRRAVVCQSCEEVIESLRSRDIRAAATALNESRERSVVFMFPGQGSQYVGMGRELYATEPVFRRQVDRCADLLKVELDVDLRELIYPAEGDGSRAAALLQQTWFTQPALFVIEYALAQLWLDWGIVPQAMIGHSIGEYVAACLSGVMSLEDALKLVAARGRLMRDLPGGAMLSVNLSENDLGDLAAEGLSLAAVNAPARCVLSGPEEAVESLERRLIEQGQRCSRLHTSHAFHSDMMEPILERFAALVGTIVLCPPKIPMISNLTGTWITPAEATDPSYYARHLRRTVRFAAGIGAATREADRILLEVGPGRTLSSLVQQSFAERSGPIVVTSMRHPQQREHDTAVLLNALGRLWLAGMAVDWSSFHANERRCRLPLPTYPFERQRHWIEPGRQAAEERPVARPGARKRDLSEWFYLPAWKQTATVEAEDAGDGRSLLFVEASGIGDRIARQLEKLNRDIVAVVPGDRAGWIGKRSYSLDPRRKEDYVQLIEELKAIGKLPRTVIHAWNVESARGSEISVETFEKAQDIGFYSLLFLAQALAESAFADFLDIAVLTSGVHAVTGEEALRPERAPLLGATIVLSQEYSNLNCRHIDIVPSEPGSEPEAALIAQIVKEIGAAAPEAVVAYRGGERWVQDFRPARLEPDSTVPGRLRERGVYLVTGGLGAIGFALAEYLAANLRARLVLTGRSLVPDRGKWMGWLEQHGAGDPTSVRIQRIRSLEALGAEVMVISADSGDREQMQAALSRVENRFGHIDGVIHGAGIVSEDAFLPLSDTTPSACERHFHPKAHGLLILHELLKQKQPPDFYFLLSSISSVVGGLGYAPYAAANLFLDAYAQRYAREAPGTWISANWDAWRFGTVKAEKPGFGSVVADLAMSAEEGVEAFRRILSSSLDPQIVVSTTDLATRIEQWVNRKSGKVGNVRQKQEAPSPPLSTEGSAAEGVLDTEMQQVVATIWREVLEVDRIEIQDNFFDLGGDSLLLMDVIARLKSVHGIVLNPREIMFQTLGQLAALCEERRPDQKSERGHPRKAGLVDSIKRKFHRGDGS